VKSVGAGKGRVEGNSQAPGLATKGHAQDVEHQGLTVERVSARMSAAALSDPGVWRSLCNHLEKSVTDLRKQMDMLMAVHEIGRAGENIDKSLQLCGDLNHQHFGMQAACNCRPQNVVEGQEPAFAQRRKIRAQRTDRRGQRDVQADSRALFLATERV